MKFAKLISYFFHPINFSIIGAILYFILIPRYIFKPLEHNILIVIFIGTYLFPVLLLFIMKKFKMIQSYQIANIEERKFPTLLFIGISLIIWNWLQKTNLVDLLSLFYLGYAICLLLSYILLNFNHKISLHMAAVGGLIGFILYFSFFYEINLLLLIIALFIISGIIASARLRLNAHTFSEVFIGFILGVISQIITFLVYSM
jgi:membrane-associated phospholipid phosphatase